MDIRKIRAANSLFNCNDACCLEPPHWLRHLDGCASSHLLSNGQVVAEQNLSENYWFLCSGVAKQCVPYADGRDQIVDILLPGEFSDVVLSSHAEVLEAVSDHTLIIRYPRGQVDALVRSDVVFATEFQRVTLNVLTRLRSHLLSLGTSTAIGKVSSFILEMKARLFATDSDAFNLPVSRCDIAQYLAISVETVSRSLTSLREQGAIHLQGSRIKITDIDALAAHSFSQELVYGDKQRERIPFEARFRAPRMLKRVAVNRGIVSDQ